MSVDLSRLPLRYDSRGWRGQGQATQKAIHRVALSGTLQKITSRAMGMTRWIGRLQQSYQADGAGDFHGERLINPLFHWLRKIRPAPGGNHEEVGQAAGAECRFPHLGGFQSVEFPQVTVEFKFITEFLDQSAQKIQGAVRADSLLVGDGHIERGL